MSYKIPNLEVLDKETKCFVPWEDVDLSRMLFGERRREGIKYDFCTVLEHTAMASTPLMYFNNPRVVAAVLFDRLSVDRINQLRQNEGIGRTINAERLLNHGVPITNDELNEDKVLYFGLHVALVNPETGLTENNSLKAVRLTNSETLITEGSLFDKYAAVVGQMDLELALDKLLSDRFEVKLSN